MSIIENVSLMVRNYKELMNLPLSKLAEKLEIPISSLQCYLKGTSDLRASTIELLAKKMNVPIAEMVSGPDSEWERAETVIRAAKELSELPEEKRRQGIELFLQLVVLFSEDK